MPPSFATPSVTGTDATVSVMNPGTDPCTLHYVVLDSSAAVPDVSFIRAHASVDTVLIAAGATEDVSVSDLSAGTYVFHGFFEYSSGVVSSVSSSSEFTILHAPAFASPSVTGTDVTVSVTNPGADPYTLYYVILDSSSAVPDVSFIRAHASVDTVLIAVGATEDVSVSGLSADTYVFYGFFAHSSGADSSVSSSPAFTVGSVSHAPVFDTPSVTSTDVTVLVTNPGADPCTLYYAMFPSSAAVPDVSSIRAHSSVGMVLIDAGATEVAFALWSQPGTYVFHGFFEYSSGVVSSVSSSSAFAIVRPPEFSTPSVTGTDATVSVTNRGGDSCTLYYVVLDSSYVVPDVPFIRTHLSTGTVLIAPGGTEDVSVSDLPDGTYLFHGFFAHSDGTDSPVSSSSAFSVGSVSHAPDFATPSVTGTDATVSVTNRGGDSCTLYHVVLDSSAAVPDVSSIRAHSSVGTVLIAAGAAEDAFALELSAGTYVFHGFFEHSSGAVSSVSSSSVFTVVGSVSHAPVFDTPSVAGADVTVSVTNPGTDPCTLYYVVLDSSSAAPDASSIRAHASVGTVLIGPGAAEEASASGLSAGTYVFHGFFVHSSSAVSPVSNSASFAIVSTVSLLPPSIASITPDITSASVSIQNNNSSALRVYWVALLATAPAPTTTAAIESATALNGNVSVAGNATQDVSILGLAPNTAYTFYAFFKSTASPAASSGIVSSVPFTTLEEEPLGLGIPSVSLSPNPVEDVLVVESPSVGVLLLYTLSGTVLDSHDVAVGENAFSFTDYPSGIYVVRLIFAGREVSHRIVKQ